MLVEDALDILGARAVRNLERRNLRAACGERDELSNAYDFRRRRDVVTRPGGAAGRDNQQAEAHDGTHSVRPRIAVSDERRGRGPRR